jgi:hypothetical protein
LSYAVHVQLLAAGDLTDYDADNISSVAEAIAELAAPAAVRRSDVAVELSAASVRFTIVVAARSAAAAGDALARLTAGIGTAAAAEATLGLSLQSRPQLQVVATTSVVFASPPSPPPPRLPPEPPAVPPPQVPAPPAQTATAFYTTVIGASLLLFVIFATFCGFFARLAAPDLNVALPETIPRREPRILAAQSNLKGKLGMLAGQGDARHGRNKIRSMAGGALTGYRRVAKL